MWKRRTSTYKNYNCNKVIVLLLFYDHVYGRDGEQEERLKVMEYHDLLCVFQLLDNRDVRSGIINSIFFFSSLASATSPCRDIQTQNSPKNFPSRKERLYRKGHLVSAVHCRSFLLPFLMKKHNGYFFIIHFINKRTGEEEKSVRQATMKNSARRKWP